MIKSMRKSSLYIAITGDSEDLTSSEKSRIKTLFSGLFEKSARKVSDVAESKFAEIVYEVDKPLLRDKESLEEFFSSLEVALEELKEYNPHFTHFKKDSDINA